MWNFLKRFQSTKNTLVKPGDTDIMRDGLNKASEICFGASEAAGWWRDDTGAFMGNNPYVLATKLCLIHSEISEAMEGLRKGIQDDKLPHRAMAEVELADALIRIFDLAGALGYNLGDAVAEKMVYNAGRADHQIENRQAAGGKKF